ncbi:MAG: 23S rRNA (adenine(2503)-C(2))-methyltransferase RlmN [Clostridia bacterium]
MINLSDLTLNELEELLISLDEKKFHAKQIFKWIHKVHIENICEMTDISIKLKEKLSEIGYILKLEIIKEEISTDGTHKFLIKMNDNNSIESVLMKHNYGYSVCVSTQVGCKMGCKFCASSRVKFIRNLTPSEIEYQIITIIKHCDVDIKNIVYMGIGEPLDNFLNVVASIKNINNNLGLNIGARHISVSTCGIVHNIYKLADLNMQCTLSISLHSCDNKIRESIMPITKKYKIEEIITACKYYIKKTNRRISFEYAIIDSVNDDDALKLVKLLKGMLAHVNLIPVNEIKDGVYIKPNKEKINNFFNILNDNNIVCTIRRELGSDISAACGQLKLKEGDKY